MPETDYKFMTRHFLFRVIFLSLYLFSYTRQSHACHAGTLIFTEKGLVLVEKLKNGDHVISLDNNGRYLSNLIKLVAPAQEKLSVIQFTFAHNEKICVVESQKFFLSNKKHWMPARHLRIGDHIARIDGSPCEIVAIHRLPGLHTVYHFDIGEPHTFFISRLGIMTHNMEFANAHALSLSITSGLIAAGGSTLSTLFATTLASPLLPLIAATAGSIALGSAIFFACKTSRKHHSSTALERNQVIQAINEFCKYDNPNEEIIAIYEKELRCYKPCTCPCHEARRSSAAGECNNHECSKKHNGNLYEANRAHPNNGARDGYKSPGLNNKAGQFMLDRAVNVDPAGKTMVATLNHLIAVLKLTRKNALQNKRIYHGFISEWDRLQEDVKGALKRYGLANSKGKLASRPVCIKKELKNNTPHQKKYCCACRTISE